MSATEARPLGELLGELATETGALVSKEVQLAKLELTSKAREGAKGIGAFALGLVVLQAGIVLLLATAALGLAMFLPMWTATLAVGCVAAGAGYAVMQRAVARLERLDVTPHKTVRTLERTKDWAKEQLS